MPRHLVDLPPEIQLKITDELLQDTDDSSEDSECEEGVLYNRPLEKPEDKANRHKWERQKRRLQDLMNWSCTSVFFRDMLAPYVFEVVNLSNKDSVSSSVIALSQSRHNKYVQQLIYTGTAPGDAHRDEKEYTDTAAIFPNSTASILSDLKCFPNLETFSIEFPYEFWNYNEWVGELYYDAEEESDADVIKGEDQFAWRALMAKTYNSLLQNETAHIKALEIRQLSPKKLSVFTNSAFHDFLGGLERFSLSIYGEGNGGEVKINTASQYQELAINLDEYFFDHLTNVTELVLKAPEEGPLGSVGMLFIPLALKKDQMPRLKTLQLECVFVGQELIDFLVGHTETLECVSMHNCSASVDGLPEDITYWNQFFDSLHNAKFERLNSLMITPERALLTEQEAIDRIIDDDDEDAVRPHQVREILEILKNDDTRRLFAYTFMDYECGNVYPDEPENGAAFLRGEDQASYERLMSHVVANGARKNLG